jgi:co-chaperonin GroES (HSP10)
MTNKHQPIFTKVLIKPEPVTEQKKGSIIIPEIVMDAEPLAFARVVSVGHKCEVVKPDDRILYPKGVGTLIKLDEEDHYVITENEIIMID